MEAASGNGPGIAERSRVVMVDNPQATSAYQPRPEVIRNMIDTGILKLSRQTNLAAAWRTFVSTQDVVGIKVFSAAGTTGTRPVVVGAIIEGLLTAGVESRHIIIWDKQLADLSKAGFVDLAGHYKVKVAGSANAGYDEKVFYQNEVPGHLVWGDLEFGRKGENVGHRSFVTQLLTHQITKIINVPPMLNHNYAGITGALYSLALGSVDNTIRFEGQPERLASAVPEIYNLPVLSDHVALNVMDGLIGQYQGEQLSLLHYSTELNQIWLSRDPVAVDVLALQELERERKLANMPQVKSNFELYQNAALLELGLADPKRMQIELVK